MCKATINCRSFFFQSRGALLFLLIYCMLRYSYSNVFLFFLFVFLNNQMLVVAGNFIRNSGGERANMKTFSVLECKLNYLSAPM